MRISIPGHLLAAFGLTLLLSTPGYSAVLSSDELAGLDLTSSTEFDEVYVHLTRLPLSLRSVDVSIGIEDASLRRQLGTRDLERLRLGFQEQLSEAAVGPSGSVTLEITLTELVPNVVLANNGGRTARYHPSIGIGSASMEAVFRNANTGEVLMVIRDAREGLKLSHNPHMLTQQVWGDASDILSDWGAELPNALR